MFRCLDNIVASLIAVVAVTTPLFVFGVFFYGLAVLLWPSIVACR